MQGFFKCDHDIGFNIGSTLRRGLTSAKSAESRAAAAAAEKRFEEIAETSATKFELDAATIAAPLIKSTAGLLLPFPLPAGRRLGQGQRAPRQRNTAGR